MKRVTLTTAILLALSLVALAQQPAKAPAGRSRAANVGADGEPLPPPATVPEEWNRPLRGGLGATSAPATSGPTRPAVAASLLQLARQGDKSANPRLFVRRAEALAQLALREDPSLADAWQLIAEAQESSSDLAAAAQAQAQYLAMLGRTDYDGTLRWVRYAMGTVPLAGQRITLLHELVVDTKRPAWERSAAWANMGVILENDGKSGEALEDYREALKLDGTQRAGLEGVARLSDSYGPAEQAAGAVAMLQGNPLAVNVAWELGQLCRQQGLYDRAVSLYDYAFSVARQTEHYPSAEFRRDLLDALLDAGLTDRAIKEFASEIDTTPPDMGILALLAETYQKAGKSEEQKKTVAVMTDEYGQHQVVVRVPGPQAAELAWFNAFYRDSQLTAMNWADVAMEKAPDNALARRVWAHLYFRSTDAVKAKEAKRMMEELAPSDAYALGDTIDEQVRQGHVDQANASVEKALLLPRTGTSWRYLSAIAARHGLPLNPRTKFTDAVAARVEPFFKQGAASLGLEPAAHLAVTLDSAGAVSLPHAAATPASGPLAASQPATREVRTVSIEPGRPLMITAVLSNVGATPVPLGEWGLISPRAVITVHVEADDGRIKAEARVPVVWAAPQLLEAGKSLRQQVSLEVPEIAAVLANRPLDEVTLTVGAIIDPVERRGLLAPAIKSLQVQPLAVHRKALLENFAPEAYERTLSNLDKAVRGGDEAAAGQAATIITQLATLIQTPEADRPLSSSRSMTDLRDARVMELLRYCLQEAAAAVRIKTLEHLGHMALSDRICKMMAPCLAHADPAVRAWAIDLLCREDATRFRDILAAFAQHDADPLVRQLAQCGK
jgi:tetratricopeptide (TPR) repeat protein